MGGGSPSHTSPRSVASLPRQGHPPPPPIRTWIEKIMLATGLVDLNHFDLNRDLNRDLNHLDFILYH